MASRARCLVLLVLVLAGASPAAAQRIASPYRFVDETQSVEVFAGWVLPDAGALELGGIAAPAFGARYGIRLNGPFTVEGAATWLPLSRAVVDTIVQPDSTFAVRDTAGMNVLLLTGALRFDLTGPRTWRGIMPYFTAIGGVAVDMSGDDEAEQGIPVEARFDFGTSFAGGLGAGLEWFATPRLTFRADARDVLWKLETPEPLLTRDLTAPDEEWVQNVIISLGASVRF